MLITWKKTHIVSGFPVEPAHAFNAQSQADCEAEASNGPWWCQNDIGGNWGEEITPCHERYFDQECWNNPDCNWRWAECTQKPNEIQEACHETASGGPINDETTCESNAGCQWESGYDDWGNYNGNQPHCRFECPGLSRTVCESISTECDWVIGGDSGYSYCGFSLLEGTTGPGECNVANEALMMSNLGDCWWNPDDQNDFQGSGNCSCNTWDWETPWETACPALGTGFSIVSETEPDYCEWPHVTSPCDNYTYSTTCQADYENHCMWDGWAWNDATQSNGICQQDIWYSDGSSCWDQSMQFASTCLADLNCEWFDPGEDVNPDWAQDGLCENFDPCYYNENDNMSGGWEFEQQCNQDQNCYWDPGQGGQGAGCFENAYEQWCDCRYEYTSETCDHPMIWESFDNYGGQCLSPMSQWECEYGGGGPSDGYIDCSMYEQDIDRFQEWQSNQCVEIKTEVGEGEWYMDGSSLCHTKEDLSLDCSTIYNFEKCECTPECHWNGDGDPMMDPYTWENNGSCDGNGPDEGGGRVSAHINPRINGTNSIYENVNPTLLQKLYHLNSSSSQPEGFECGPFILLDNGNIEMTDEDGCTTTLVKVEVDF